MRKKTKENKEELKTGGIIIMYVVKKKEEKEGTSGYPKFVTSLARMAFPPSLFLFLFSIKFCSDNFATVPLKNVCFSCGDFYDARRWCHDDFTHVFWGGRVGGTERKRRLNLPLV